MDVVQSVLPAAAVVFGDRLASAQRYVELLIGDGVLRGLLGPREPARIWTRHLLNSAVLGEVIPGSATGVSVEQRVVDVGSGAGLPGVPLALARPDLHVVLVEPMQRRCDFLVEVVTALELGDRVQVVRGRAEDAAVRAIVGGADWVTARAVAPLARLVAWCIPLAGPQGRLALIKGESAAVELERDRAAVLRAGGRDPVVVSAGVGMLSPPVAVVTMSVSPPRRRPAAAARTRDHRRGQHQ